jgi:molecular chaperone GrpE
MNPSDEESQGPVIRDRRRIDPLTGQVRDIPGSAQPGRHSASQQSGQHATPPPSAAGGGAAPGGGTAPSSAPGSPGSGAGGDPNPQITLALAERTADLQRLQAEYANYRKRVERDRVAVREQALASVLSELLPVLDDIGRAREHGELTGGFKSVAESLEASAAKLGLTTYGEAGDPFDPTLHEALMHSYSAEVTEPTAVQILQPGYKVGDRIVRPARVAVAEPGDDTPGAAAEDE